MLFDTVLEHVRMPDGRLASIGIAAGQIAAITSNGLLRPASNRYDLRSALVLPGFVDGHVHLDTTFFGDIWRPHQPCAGAFSVQERLAIQKEWLRAGAPFDQRASTLVKRAIACGTIALRTHIEIDVDLGLNNLDTILEIRERHRDAISIEIVGLARGLLRTSGTLQLLEEALHRGVEVVGGVDPATFEGDVTRHLDLTFGVADRHGKGIDLHLHDFGPIGLFQLDAIAERTKALGMNGRVAVAHAYALGSSPDHAVRATASKLAEAGVAIMTNAPGNLPMPPVLRLQEAGVMIFAGSDDVRNSWWPYGDGDMLERAMLIGYRSGFLTDEHLQIAFDLITKNAATALGLSDYGLRIGASADLVVLNAAHAAEAVVARPSERVVFKSGRVVAGTINPAS